MREGKGFFGGGILGGGGGGGGGGWREGGRERETERNGKRGQLFNHPCTHTHRPIIVSQSANSWLTFTRA